MSTPGGLLKTDDPKVAADWVERLAWMETLERVEDWSIYQELFPKSPAGGVGWSGGLARELLGLRRTLQENGHTLSSTAKFLANSIEAGRWSALATLESQMEACLRNWNFKSRSRVLAAGVSIPSEIKGIVLAGVTEMPPLVERALAEWSGPVTILIGAPENEAENFSPIGRPLAAWKERVMAWPEGDAGSVILTNDPRQEAIEALRVILAADTPPDQVALGTADPENGDEIAEVFSRAGWTAFHPASTPPSVGATRWFKQWSAWMRGPTLAVLADLLTLPESEILTGLSRAELAETLSRLRNEWVMIRPDDLRQRMRGTDFRSREQLISAQQVVRAVEILEGWFADFRRKGVVRAMGEMLDLLDTAPAADHERITAFHEWIENSADMIGRLDHPPDFWILLMLEGSREPGPKIPDGRVIDVQGWLELFFESGRHLVLCGVNEGKLPARNAGDPWLGEAARKSLHLNCNDDRAARDAFLYQAMIEARRDGGRVDCICSKTGPGGEARLPSRLLLAASQEDLPQRVRFLFRELAPPEARLRWQGDFKWQARAVEIPNKVSVTSLGIYLACPFRFYLKHAIRAQSPDTGRVEWNARDFGNIAHDILENWGRDPDARDFSKTETLHDWFCEDLRRIVSNQFGSRIPLAVRIQIEALKQRLLWLARVQAGSRAEGWEVLEVEQDFLIPVGESIIKARIDRIDLHRESGQLRVLDYKTGKTKTPESAHCLKVTARSNPPSHLEPDGSAFFDSNDARGKPVRCRWTNLQLPLYVLAVREKLGIFPVPCYFQLGNTENDVRIDAWEDFSERELQSAAECAEWIIGQIRAGVFWPPAEKVEYDDLAILTMGRPASETFLPGLPI
jgi:ATP-dependent helicase/nuclease subunit B